MTAELSQPKIVRQFVSEVIDFSSQYGADTSRGVSYSVSNIVAGTRIFPAYGDFTQAAVFRTYGPWWIDSNIPRKPSSRPRSKSLRGKDYMDLLFDELVYPQSIGIYETYNPGAIVRILALTQENHGKCMLGSRLPYEQEQSSIKMTTKDYAKWEVLWECIPGFKPLDSPNRSRMFAPLIKELDWPTRLIRLEFCSKDLDYYTEIDAVELTGTAAYHSSSSVDPPTNLLNGLYISEKTDVESGSLRVAEDGSDPCQDNGYFESLPLEVLHYIFSFLPLLDLCQCARVCKLFYQLTYDPSQFSEIDLSHCWHLINDEALLNVASRCNSLSTEPHMQEDQDLPTVPQVQAVDLSWCGGGGIISKEALNRFVKSCCSGSLAHLVLASSPAVSDEALRTIADSCPNLMCLDIQSCMTLSSEGLQTLSKLSNLQVLNLYRTKIDDFGIKSIISSNPNITKLNIGSCTKILDYDEVLGELANCCMDLSMLDCWRAKSLTSEGLNLLSENCCRLAELDLGWCGGLQSSSACFQTLAMQCPHLTTLYVTANRTLCDADVDALAKNCQKLEKLDILGTSLVSVSSMTDLLFACKNLYFLDVSFCQSFTKEVVELLRQQFPNVAIKRSFQEETLSS